VTNLLLEKIKLGEAAQSQSKDRRVNDESSDPRAIDKIQTSQRLCDDCRFCADIVVETQIYGHLDLATATALLARPD
jgi:hypothetical protein